MDNLRNQIKEMLDSSDRDFNRLNATVIEYIKAFKTNDYLLGYAEIENKEV